MITVSLNHFSFADFSFADQFSVLMYQTITGSQYSEIMHTNAIPSIVIAKATTYNTDPVFNLGHRCKTLHSRVFLSICTDDEGSNCFTITGIPHRGDLLVSWGTKERFWLTLATENNTAKLYFVEKVIIWGI